MITAVDIIQIFDQAIVDTWGPHLARPWPHSRDKTWADKWLAAGATVEMCLQVFKADMERKQAQKRSIPSCLAYYDNPIRDAIAAQQQEDKDAKAMHPEDLRWKVRVQGWQRNPSFWHEDLWGPVPGAPGCRIPSHVLKAIGV